MSTEATPTAAVETQVSSSKYDPSAFLHEITGNNVVVKLSSGVEFHGKNQKGLSSLFQQLKTDYEAD